MPKMIVKKLVNGKQLSMYRHENGLYLLDEKDDLPGETDADKINFFLSEFGWKYDTRTQPKITIIPRIIFTQNSPHQSLQRAVRFQYRSYRLRFKAKNAAIAIGVQCNINHGNTCAIFHQVRLHLSKKSSGQRLYQQ